MANIKKVLMGMVYFIGGYFIILILGNIMPWLIPSLGSILTENTTALDNFSYLMTIIAYILFGLIVPMANIIGGLQEERTTSKFAQVCVGIGIFFFGLLLTYYGWYIKDVLLSVAPDEIAKAIFWIGLLITWIMIILITPAYLVFQTNNS